ncbi:nudix-type nucleoside diphosphatase (YffH/AdpP family) [Streptomyces brevispora]|uniref:Nudix-type nucleoside diphosphatase (YffH/AdpP family) n=1 Tax=Streptomyces brevispora TaxID=887462 RepID=A0A561UXI2_9ACTN|nr:nudix-type nucleoside diphosphatase (YffH/AdpP family) [Streptomyces brevispora]
MLIEAAAGLLDGDAPEEAIRREAAEETGHVIGVPEPVFTVYMSPGSVTERLHFYAAPYDPATTVAEGDGYGVAEESEDIATVELPFDEALAMVRTGDIADAKTIMLLQWAALDGPLSTTPPRSTLPRPVPSSGRRVGIRHRSASVIAREPLTRHRAHGEGFTSEQGGGMAPPKRAAPVIAPPGRSPHAVSRTSGCGGRSPHPDDYVPGMSVLRQRRPPLSRSKAAKAVS